MHKIINNTLSPFDIPTPQGNVRLPAMGSIEVELAGDYLNVLVASQAVRVEPVEGKKAKPVEDDQEDDIETLRAQYAELADKPADGRWSAARLRTEIDSLLVQ